MKSILNFKHLFNIWMSLCVCQCSGYVIPIFEIFFLTSTENDNTFFYYFLKIQGYS